MRIQWIEYNPRTDLYAAQLFGDANVLTIRIFSDSLAVVKTQAVALIDVNTDPAEAPAQITRLDQLCHRVTMHSRDLLTDQGNSRWEADPPAHLQRKDAANATH